MRIFLTAALFAAGSFAATPLPDSLKPPATEAVQLHALGKGQQVYKCQAKAGGGGFEWVLLKPRADLFDENGRHIGKHYEGPTWEAADGSKVTGRVLQRAPAPNAESVPWLLLKAASHDGDGIMAHVTYVNRLDTQGGLAPSSGCDEVHQAAETAVDYQAGYVFYTSAH